MTEETDDTGRLVAFKNKDLEPGVKQPSFKGTITFEGSADKRQVALWARISKKTGRTFFTGKAGETAAAQIDRIAEGATAHDENKIEDAQTTGSALAVDAHEVILFTNERKQEGTNQPDYFGYYNSGDGTKLQHLDVWAQNDKYGKPMLSGNVTAHQIKDELEQKQEKAAKKKQRSMTM